MSVNWTCAMDVAIRAVNWIFFYFHFKNLIDNDKEFLNIFNNSLYNHGKFIFLNLEKDLGYANNHYLSDLVGLFYLGNYFKGIKTTEVKEWLSFSKNKFYLVDKESKKRHPGYPLDSISIIPEFNKYFTDLTEEEKEQRVNNQNEDNKENAIEAICDILKSM